MAKGIKDVWIDSDSVGILGTKIYRDDILIATVPVGTLVYYDPDVEIGIEYKYVNQAYTATGESTDEVQGTNMNYYTIIPVNPLYYIPYNSIYAVDAESYLPTYDSGNATHKLIQNDADWSDINDPALRHFFVEPFDYTGSVKTITQSGLSDSDRRTIQLYNGNNTHPGSLPTDTTNLAKVRLLLQASYWVIDRVSYWTDSSDAQMITMEGASDNILNRIYAYNMGGGTVYLYESSNRNIIQNSYMHNDDITIKQDRAAIGLSYTADGQENINNIICQNDIYNRNDGVQLIRQKDRPNMNYEGTKIDCNRIWIDSTLYTDNLGNHDPNGDYAMAENAIDIKCASTNPANPVVITNNYLSGYRPSDSTGGGVNDSTGAAMVIHYDVQNLTVRNNYFRDSTRGVVLDDPIITTVSVDAILNDNIFDDVKLYVVNYDGTPYVAIDSIVEDNLIINCGSETPDHIVRLRDCENAFFTNNRMFNCTSNFGTSQSGSTGATISGNKYYNFSNRPSPSENVNLSDASDEILGSDPTVNYEDLQLTIKGFTTSPETILLANRIDLATGFVPQIVGGEAPDYPDPDLYDELDRPMPSDPISLGAAGINSPLGTIFFEFSTNQLTGNMMTFGLALNGGSFIVISLGTDIDKMAQLRRIDYGSTDGSGDLLGNDFTTTNKAAIVWNGTSQLLYLNGALLNSLVVTDPVGLIEFDQIKFTRAADTTNPFLGTMNRVALWSTQLTEAQAIALTTL